MFIDLVQVRIDFYKSFGSFFVYRLFKGFVRVCFKPTHFVVGFEGLFTVDSIVPII